MDFHLPPLCPVFLGFSFNLKRIGRRGLGAEGGEGSVDAWGMGRSRKSCRCVAAMKSHQIGLLSLLEFGTHHEKLARHLRAASSNFNGQKPPKKPKKRDKTPRLTPPETVFLFLVEGKDKQMKDQV